MLIIGCDFHPGFEQIAEEVRSLRLQHPEEAREFYGRLKEPARVAQKFTSTE